MRRRRSTRREDDDQRSANRDAAVAAVAAEQRRSPPKPNVAPAEGDVSATHPDYAERAGEWQLMRDCARGASAVEAAGDTYLPMPSGFAAQPDGGLGMYSAYALRAQFPELVSPTVQGMVGTIHRREAQVELPASLEYLWEDCDGRGLPLEALHRRITQEVLTVGRYALMADAPRRLPDGSGGGDPRIVGYRAEALINWSEDRDFFVLSEARLERAGFVWEDVPRWRVLELLDGVCSVTEYDRDRRAEDPVVPTARGGEPLRGLPLVVAGARNLDVAPDESPLVGVGRSALAIYRLDADMRHQLFMSGQETLVLTGVDEADIPRSVGAGVVLSLPKDSTAAYVGPQGVGIEKHRQAIIDERENAAALGARLFDTQQKAGVESGDALRIRVGATTATLVSVATVGAQAMEQVLRWCGRLQGLSEAEVSTIVVTPNLKFLDALLDPASAMSLVTMWQSGAFSYETLYENLQRGGIASQERTAEAEQELVSQESPEGDGSSQFAEEGLGSGGSADGSGAGGAE